MFGNSGKGKMVIIIALAAVAVLAGLGIVMLKGKGGGKAEPVKLPTSEMKLGEFIVNLADADEVRYLKTDLVLEVEGTLPAAGGKEGEGEGGGDPRVRDAIIQVMSSKRFNELGSPEGKEKLKKDIMAAVNQRLKDDNVKVVEVFFNEFAMQ